MPESHHPITRQHDFDAARFERAINELLAACGIPVQAPHTDKTAHRVRELWQKRLLDGYNIDPAEALGTGFTDPQTDMVIVRDITIHGICPHHLVPFRGVAHVAYLPGGRLHGFGRIARMVDALSHRLTYQEWITRDIAQALVEYGAALGGACLIEAEQLCLLLGENRRGGERVITQSFSGIFNENASHREAFFRALGR